MGYNPEKNSPKFKYANVSEVEVSTKQMTKIKYEAELLRKDVSYIIKCYPYLLEEKLIQVIEKTEEFKDSVEDDDDEETTSMWNSSKFWGYV